MRNLGKCILSLCVLLPASLLSQEVLSIGEVFDFDIGDEFHYTGSYGWKPFRFHKMIVEDKTISVNNDTIKYNIVIEGIMVTNKNGIVSDEFFRERKTEIFYNLDSSVLTYDSIYNIIKDTSLFDTYGQRTIYRPELCNTLVSSHSIGISGREYPALLFYHYGKGLGETHFGYVDGSSKWPTLERYMFYFRKGDFECGEPDTTVIPDSINSTIELISSVDEDFNIYPIPSGGPIYVESYNPDRVYSLGLFRTTGQRLFYKSNCIGKSYLDITDYHRGMYFIRIYSNGRFYSKRIIRK